MYNFLIVFVFSYLIIKIILMWKDEIIIESWVRERIFHSKILSNEEKDNFLRYIWYFTPEEKEELLLMI